MPANALYHTVRHGMKGQPESLVERAILQARQEAVGIPVKVNIDSGGKPNGVPERR